MSGTHNDEERFPDRLARFVCIFISQGSREVCPLERLHTPIGSVVRIFVYQSQIAQAHKSSKKD